MQFLQLLETYGTLMLTEWSQVRNLRKSFLFCKKGIPKDLLKLKSKPLRCCIF